MLWMGGVATPPSLNQPGNFECINNFISQQWELKLNQLITYQLKPEIRYPDAALTSKLSGLSIQADYHFLLLLKSVQAFNTSTGRIIPFLTFKKTNTPEIAQLLGIKKSTFYGKLSKLISRGWLTKHKASYNLKALSKINKELNFNLYTSKQIINDSPLTYYTYRKLQNVQGIDLDAHRIYNIIKLKNHQFRHAANNPKNNMLTSSVNQLVIDQMKTKKANYSQWFGISMDTIQLYGGYDSKIVVWNKLKEMESQGLKIKKDKSVFDRFKQRDCNQYDVSYDGSFTLTSTVKKKKEFVKKQVLNQTELKFNDFLNNTGNRITMIDAGVLSRNYLKFTRTGKLVTIPKRCWNKILIAGLNNEFFKPVLVHLLGTSNISVASFTKKAMFVKYLNADERFGSVMVHTVGLVEGTGNYKNQCLSTYTAAVSRRNRDYRTHHNERVAI